MDQAADQQCQSVEEVKWTTTTTTKSWTTSSTSETSQGENILNSNANQLDLDKSIGSNLLGNLQEKEIKINIENRTDNHSSISQNANTSSVTSKMQSSTTLAGVRETAVMEHNRLRSIHQAPALKPDARLHDEAQRYAESLAKGNKDTFKTSKTYKYGENIATSTKKDMAEAVKDAITRMYETSKFYDYQRPGYNVDNHPTGLFTSIVWKSAERIGVGCAWNQIEENYSIVFYYDPMTNVTNDFKDNVLPPRA